MSVAPRSATDMNWWYTTHATSGTAAAAGEQRR
jgi:hypothetical protein